MRLKPVDLVDHLQLGVDHIYQSMDRQHGFHVYFHWDPIGGSAHHAGSLPDSHMPGRFLDVLALCSRIFDMPVDEEAIEGLSKQVFDCLRIGNGLAWAGAGHGAKQRYIAEMHSQRETLLALIALMTWRNSRRAVAAAQRMVKRIEQVTRKTGCFPGDTLTRRGWESKREGPSFGTTADIGRLIGALVKYYRISSDSTALIAAQRFSDFQLEHSFGADGRILENAGGHMHSVTGTISGIIDFGRLVHDHSYVEAGRRIYDVGMPEYRTSYGWVKESREGKVGRGEPNNTADLVEAALYLGQAGYPQYYEDAETMVRNLLVRCQILNTDWCGDGGGKLDTETDTYTNVRQRLRGAFYFPTPNDFSSCNSDLTGAVMQGLCEAWDAIDREAEGTVWINLLLDKTANGVEVKSQLPVSGRVKIKAKRSTGVAVRIPPWVDRGKLRATVDGRLANWHCRGSYLAVDLLRRGSTLKIAFHQPQRVAKERPLGWPHTYRVTWHGNSVVSIRPKGKICPLFPE